MLRNRECGMLCIHAGSDESAWMFAGDCAMLADLLAKIGELAETENNGRDTATARYTFQFDSKERVYETVKSIPLDHLLVWYRCWVKYKIIPHEGERSVKKSDLWKALASAATMACHARWVQILPKPKEKAG